MTARASLVLKNVTLPDGRVADISINNGTVVHVGAGVAREQVIDCAGLLVLPAATDLHVHMRGGTQSGKEDWRTGSRSALAGGVTLVVDQPNTVPPLTTPELYASRVDEARRHSACHFAINSGVTEGTDIRKMWLAGALAFGETFVSPSSYGGAISMDTLGRSLEQIRNLGALATIHAEKIAPVPGTDPASHDRARSPRGERDTVTAVRQANRAGCRLLFCHLSTAAAVDAAPGSVEVTPHHLFLSRESCSRGGGFCKVNPPLRDERERGGLWTRWDRIDVLASDHAPHTIAEKHAPFCEAPAGLPGVETMMPLLVARILDKSVTAASLIQKTATTPAFLLGIQKAGFEPGDRADFAVYRKTVTKIRTEDLHSRSGWTPFEGMPAVFPATVIMGGTVVYEDREFFPGNPQWFFGKGYRKW